MKLEITLKKVISVLVTGLVEELLRFGIGKINFQAMDKTFLITIPFCLICLLAYWIFDFLKRRFDKQDQEIKLLREKDIGELNLSLREILKDQALRIRFINQCLMYKNVDKVHYEQAGFSNEDLKAIGFSDKIIVKAADRESKEEDRMLSITNMSNRNIKGQ